MSHKKCSHSLKVSCWLFSSLNLTNLKYENCLCSQITFPGVSVETFTALQEYLYTGKCRHLESVDNIELIELANRLCLPRLLAMTEDHIVQKLQETELAGREIYEDALWLIEPAQVCVYRDVIISLVAPKRQMLLPKVKQVLF